MFNILVIHPLKMYLERENRTDFLGETFIAVSLIKGCRRLGAMLPFPTKKESTGRRGGQKQTREKSLPTPLAVFLGLFR